MRRLRIVRHPDPESNFAGLYKAIQIVRSEGGVHRVYPAKCRLSRRSGGECADSTVRISGGGGGSSPWASASIQSTQFMSCLVRYSSGSLGIRSNPPLEEQ